VKNGKGIEVAFVMAREQNFSWGFARDDKKKCIFITGRGGP
jgi:hypothetical protein